MVDVSAAYELATGTATGKDHYHTRRNGQDALWVERTPRAIAAVVCDGCGDPASPCSEVGAALGAHVLARRLCGLADMGEPVDTALERARLDALAHLSVLATAMGEPEDIVRRYFLFTVVGALITEREAAFFSIGDGLIAVNGRLLTLGPYPDNAPPYMAYALVPYHHRADAHHFTVHVRVPTAELDRFLLGTDGAAPLLGEDLTTPGKDDPAGGLEGWWREDRYYDNPAALPNRLRLLATDSVKIDWEARGKLTDWGRLQDDATLVLGRRAGRKEAANGEV